MSRKRMSTIVDFVGEERVTTRIPGRPSLNLNGGQRRDRTADAGLFRAALYH
jgi:hypothetical protein